MTGQWNTRRGRRWRKPDAILCRRGDRFLEWLTFDAALLLGIACGHQPNRELFAEEFIVRCVQPGPQEVTANRSAR